MSKRDTRRALTKLFSDRDEAVTLYAIAFEEREKMKRRLRSLDAKLKELRRKAMDCGARAHDLEAAERAMLDGLDDGADGMPDDAGHPSEPAADDDQLAVGEASPEHEGGASDDVDMVDDPVVITDDGFGEGGY